MPLSFTGPDSFYSYDEEAWWAAVDKALKGAPRERLFDKTEDGLEIAPLYRRRADVPARALRTGGRDWSVVQRIDIPDASLANAQILEDLEGGASGIEIVFSSAVEAHRTGVSIDNMQDLERLLDGVQPELIDLRLEGGRENAEILALVLAYLEKQKVDLAGVRISAGFNPVGWVATHGRMLASTANADAYLRDVAISVDRLGSPARLFKADGHVWHGAGATPAQELAFVLASAARYLRVLEGTGLPPERWADRLSVSLVADADQFGTIAKARALRALWACLLDGAELPQTPAKLHMCTSFRMLTRKDPWVNLLRNTVAAFAAGIGGADSICVLPHTFAVGLPDGFARRLARNTQSILLEESNLGKVIDPAAGAGAIEDRTEKLSLAAWELFQEIEAAGGIAQALREGIVQDRIAASGAALQKSVARRLRPITGVSEFPDLSEKNVTVLNAPQQNVAGRHPATNLPEPGPGTWFDAVRQAALAGTSLPDLSPRVEQMPGVIDIAALEPFRLSEPFEALRAAADDQAAASGTSPQVFLASLGTLAQFSARATWTANAFAAGGIRAAGPSVHASLEDLVAAFLESGASLACVVSSDEVYETEAEAAARALMEAGAEFVYLAGRPGGREEAYRAAGVGAFLYAGCDLLNLLEEAHAKLGTVRQETASGQEVHL